VIGTRTCGLVRLGNAPMAPTLFIDVESGDLRQQQSVSNRPGVSDTNVIVYSDWRMRDGLRVPYKQQVLRNGVVVDEFDIRTVTVDKTLSERAFARPDGFETVAALPLPGAPDVVTLAPDVYLLRRAYNSLAVVMAEYVVILEPVMGPVVSDATLKAVEQIAPGKPVRYVIATHFHADHIGGARRYLESGVTLVTTNDTARVLKDAVEKAAIETVETHRTIRDAGHTIEIYQIGPNPHASEMLIVYLPKQRLLFEGDLLDIDGSAEVPALAGKDTRDFARRIERLGLDVQTVVPVHGRVGTLEDLRRALNLRVPR
jgi:glyoxylase-like metal-dependent hydrolase (beta-lactamase superfamily II)